MDLQLKGMTALVTAASKGIGFGVAEGLAKEGCNLVLTASNAERLDAAGAKLRRDHGVEVWTQQLDLRDPQAVRPVLGRIGASVPRIDVLIVNGPGPKPMDAAVLDAATLQAALDTTLKSPVELCRHVLPGMIEARFGRIVFIASSTAKEPDEGMVLSNVTRAGVIAYAKTLSREVARHGITVNAILTGSVLTGRTNELLKFEAEKAGVSLDRFLEEAARSIPAGYICTPSEFAQTIVYLCSKRAAYVNGVSLPIDGGYMRGL